MVDPGLEDRDAKTERLLEMIAAVQERLQIICERADRIIASTNGVVAPHA